MELSRIVVTTAVVLAVVLCAGYALGEESEPVTESKPTVHDKVLEREALRRASVEEQKKRQQDFARRCRKPLMSPAELEACRVAYRSL